MPSTCAIISHDIGGAELALSYGQTRLAGTSVVFICDGPALVYYRDNGLPVEPLPLDDQFESRLDSLVASRGVDCIICSTGITGYELAALKCLKKKGVPTVALLEHWTAYRERFGYPDEDWRANIPDKVIVFDKKAFSLAKELGFPEKALVLEQNPRHELLRKRFLTVSATMKPDPAKFSILYLSDPLEEASLRIFGVKDYFGFSELTVLDDILESIDRNSMPSAGLVIRRHPKESAGKYDNYSSSWVRISKSGDLLDDLAEADIVIGSFSTAVVTASLVGKRSLSYIPADSIQRLADGMTLAHIPEIVSVTSKVRLASEIERSYFLKFTTQGVL